MPDEYMTLGEAREYLGISRVNIARLVKNGTLKASENPLDTRSKLVKRTELDKLKKTSKPPPKQKKASKS